MASSPTYSAGLYLDIDAGPGALERLQSALAAVRPQAILIRPSDAKPDEGALRALCACAQSAGAAALLLDNPQLAKRTGADGVHLSAGDECEERYADARRLLGKDGIVGVESGASRHDAMVLGEAGADYVAFSTTGDAMTVQAVADLASWWSEIFEVPSVALGANEVAEAMTLADAGADFVGWKLRPGQAPGDQRADLTSLAAGLGHDPAGRQPAGSTR